MELREQEALDLVLPRFQEMLDSMNRDQWFSAAFPAILDFARLNRVFDKINYFKLKKYLLKEIDDRSPVDLGRIQQELGISIKRIEKNNELYTLHTGNGVISLLGEDLFTQSVFRKKVFSMLGVYIPQVNKQDWEGIVEIWAASIQKNDTDISVNDIIEDALSQYVDDADERDLPYLRKGIPIFHEGSYCFRLSDFHKFIRKDFDASITRPQVSSVLRMVGFEDDTTGKIRYWKINADFYVKQGKENHRTAGDREDHQPSKRDTELGSALESDNVHFSDQGGGAGSTVPSFGEGGEREVTALFQDPTFP